MGVFSRIFGGFKAALSYWAGRTDGPDALWKPTNQSEDAILRKDRKLVVARARDLVRNSPHLSGALDRIVSNVLDTGVYPQARIKKGDGTLEANANARVEELFRKWAEAVGYEEASELVLRHCWTDGELLIHWFMDPDLLRQGLPPVSFELFEADHLDTMVDGHLGGGNYARQGIEYDSRNRVVAYHLLKVHPGDNLLRARFDSVRIPAEHITHIFKRRRVSQSRGLSWFAPVLSLLKDFEEYQSNERLAARAASAFGVIATGTDFPMFDTPENGDADPEDLPEFVESGRIHYLPNGANVTAFKNERPGTAYEPYSKVSMRTMSAAIGMSYEAFSNDFAGASYSSARIASMEERRGYRCQQQFLLRTWLAPLWIRFCSSLSFVGLQFPDGVPVVWQMPGWQWIDPAKDAAAVEKRLALGLTTRRKEAAKGGEDWDENVEGLKSEKDVIKKAGLEPGEEK